jgi:hypothetical protein
MSNIQTTLHGSTTTTDTFSSLTNNDAEHQICLVSDSPHYIVRVR